MSIENLKKILESERLAGSDYLWMNREKQRGFQIGHEAATNRLLPLLQKAVDMAEFVINHSMENTYNNEKAREFLSEFTKMTDIKKEGL